MGRKLKIAYCLATCVPRKKMELLLWLLGLSENAKDSYTFYRNIAEYFHEDLKYLIYHQFPEFSENIKKDLGPFPAIVPENALERLHCLEIIRKVIYHRPCDDTFYKMAEPYYRELIQLWNQYPDDEPLLREARIYDKVKQIKPHGDGWQIGYFKTSPEKFWVKFAENHEVHIWSYYQPFRIAVCPADYWKAEGQIESGS